MKRVLIVFTLIFALLLTSCTATVKKGQKLMSDREYDKAIEVFEKVIDKDETNYDAWFGIVKSQIKDDEYEDAEDTLEDLFDVIDENYDEDSEDVDYESVLEDFQDYANDIIEEEGSLGEWYTKLQPAYVDISEFDYMTYEAGTKIELTLPEDTEVYYNLEDETVTDKDTKYEDSIELTEEGTFYLSVAAVNKFGMVGPTSYASITVAEMPSMPLIDTPSGTYEAPIVVYFGTFDSDNLTIYYTIDGSDPTTNGYSYYSEDGITLPAGEVQLRAVMYDYNSGMYSPELTVDYVVEAAPGPSVDQPAGTYKAPLTLQFTDFDEDNATVYYTLDGSDPAVYGSYFDSYYGVILEKGEYQLRAVIYDYTYGYSQELAGTYIVE